MKGNQPTLYKTAQTLLEQQQPIARVEVADNSHRRSVKRHVQVFSAPTQRQRDWAGLTCFIIVDRSGIRDGKSFNERHFYMSSQSLSAESYRSVIQEHWGIENRLHWVRDVTFKEDFPPRLGGNAPVNWAILHNFFITLARHEGFRTIPQAQRALANQLHQVFSLLV